MLRYFLGFVSLTIFCLSASCGSVASKAHECETASDCEIPEDQCGLVSCVEQLCLFTASETCCGNGVLEAEEECDDGNIDDSDACLTTCVDATCGDGALHQGAEACDEGEANGNISGASCREDCTLPYCGDGINDPDLGEACDDGNDTDTDDCLHTCVEATCGDGLLNEGVEECDQGEDNSEEPNAGCRTDCQPARCGDGIIDPSLNESCDDGNDSSTDDCVENCLTASCGDSFLHEGVEECDDGNDLDTDDCVTGCIDAVCGDAFLHEGVEECDLGEVSNSDLSNAACRTTCVLPFCGDGIVDDLPPLGENCDDGNESDNDACVAECVDAVCGDGFVRTEGENPEECDAAGANADTPDAPCRSSCALPHCGDHIVDPGLDEQCDDGNLGGGDTDPCTNEACEWKKFKIPMALSEAAFSVAASIDENGDVGIAWTADAQGTGYRYVYSTLLNPDLLAYTVTLGNSPPVQVPIGIGKLVSTSENVSLQNTILITSTGSGFVIGWRSFGADFCLKKLNAAEEEAPSLVVDQSYSYFLPNLAKDPEELVLARDPIEGHLLAGWVDTGRDDCPTWNNNGVCGDPACPNANDCTDCNNCGLKIATAIRVDDTTLDVVSSFSERYLASPRLGHVENFGFCTDVNGYAHGVVGTLRSPSGLYQSVYVRNYGGSDALAANDPFFPEDDQTTYFTDISTALTHVEASRCIDSANKRLVLTPTDHLAGDDAIHFSYKDNNTEISGVFAFDGPLFTPEGSTLHALRGDPDNLVAVMTSSIGNGVLELAGSFISPEDFVGTEVDSVALFDADPEDNTDYIHDSATVVVYPDFSRILIVWVQDGVIWGRVHPWSTQ